MIKILQYGGWGYDSSGRVCALHVRGPGFDPQHYKAPQSHQVCPHTKIKEKAYSSLMAVADHSLRNKMENNAKERSHFQILGRMVGNEKKAKTKRRGWGPGETDGHWGWGVLLLNGASMQEALS